MYGVLALCHTHTQTSHPPTHTCIVHESEPSIPSSQTAAWYLPLVYIDEVANWWKADTEPVLRLLWTSRDVVNMSHPTSNLPCPNLRQTFIRPLACLLNSLWRWRVWGSYQTDSIHAPKWRNPKVANHSYYIYSVSSNTNMKYDESSLRLVTEDAVALWSFLPAYIWDIHFFRQAIVRSMFHSWWSPVLISALSAELYTQTRTLAVLIWRAISEMSFSIHVLVMCKRPAAPPSESINACNLSTQP